MLQIALTPAEHRRVECNYESGVPRLFGAPQQAGGQFVIFSPIELKPAGTVTHGLGYIFQGTRRQRAQDERDSERSGSAPRGKVGGGMKNALHSDGSQQNGGRQSAAQEFNGEIALGHVA